MVLLWQQYTYRCHLYLPSRTVYDYLCDVTPITAIFCACAPFGRLHLNTAASSHLPHACLLFTSAASQSRAGRNRLGGAPTSGRFFTSLILKLSKDAFLCVLRVQCSKTTKPRKAIGSSCERQNCFSQIFGYFCVKTSKRTL